MKTLCIPFFASLALSVSVTSCTPPPAPVPEPIPATPVPKAAPTPHPATGATEAAIRLYPDLAKKDSTFNKTFVEIYAQQKATNPDSLATVDWPLEVARRAAGILGVSEYTPPSRTTPAPVIKVAPARIPTALDRGAYDEKRGVAKPPVIYDKYGYRIR